SGGHGDDAGGDGGGFGAAVANEDFKVLPAAEGAAGLVEVPDFDRGNGLLAAEVQRDGAPLFQPVPPHGLGIDGIPNAVEHRSRGGFGDFGFDEMNFESRERLGGSI